MSRKKQRRTSQPEEQPTPEPQRTETQAADTRQPERVAATGWLRRRRWDLVAAAAVVLLALGVRTLYASVTEPVYKIQADAGKYWRLAYHLRRFGVASIDQPPPDGSAPTSRTDLRAGYSLWLQHFWEGTDAPGQPTFHLDRVLLWQRLFGTLTVLCTFVLARLSLPLGFALVAAVLTALNPHLIALEGFALTETLCTVMLMLGAAAAALAWRTRNPWLAVLLALSAGMALQYAAYIRAIAILIVLPICPLLLLPMPKESRPLRRRGINAAALAAGAAAIVIAYKSFEAKAVYVETPSGAVEPEGKRYTKLKSPLTYLGETLRPPHFYVAGESHVGTFRSDKDYRMPTDVSFSEAPMAYLRWNLVGRLILMWHWDNTFMRDVYIYDMKHKGFEENVLLKLVHRLMRALHYPLYVLALAAPLLFLLQWRRGRWRPDQHALWLAVAGFCYFIAVLTLVRWFPRYSIPARPFAAILDGGAVWVLLQLYRDWRKGVRVLPGKRQR